MVELDVLEVAHTWSFWDRDVPASVVRRVVLPEELSDSVCLVVQGVRRCGKSTLLAQMLDRYQLDPATCAFLNLEDPRLVNALSYRTLDTLVASFRARHPAKTPLTFFLDEVQVVQGWEKWMRSQLDRPAGNRFVITGSNATMHSGELSTVLTGRYLRVELFPFDLHEVRDKHPNATVARYLCEAGQHPTHTHYSPRDPGSLDTQAQSCARSSR